MRMATELVNRKLSPLTWASLVLTVIGAVNWALIGIFSWNLVAAIFGDMSWFTRLVYIVVGAAGVYLLAVAGRLRESRRGERAPVGQRPAPTV
jgi:uncharacterized protein